MAVWEAGPRSRPLQNRPDFGAIGPDTVAGPRKRPRQNRAGYSDGPSQTAAPEQAGNPYQITRRAGEFLVAGGWVKVAGFSQELPAYGRAEINYRLTDQRLWRWALADGRSRTEQIRAQYRRLRGRALASCLAKIGRI